MLCWWTHWQGASRSCFHLRFQVACGVSFFLEQCSLFPLFALLLLFLSLVHIWLSITNHSHSFSIKCLTNNVTEIYVTALRYTSIIFLFSNMCFFNHKEILWQHTPRSSANFILRSNLINPVWTYFLSWCDRRSGDGPDWFSPKYTSGKYTPLHLIISFFVRDIICVIMKLDMV